MSFLQKWSEFISKVVPVYLVRVYRYLKNVVNHKLGGVTSFQIFFKDSRYIPDIFQIFSRYFSAYQPIATVDKH